MTDFLIPGDKIMDLLTGKEYLVENTSVNLITEELFAIVKTKRGLLELPFSRVRITARRLFGR